MHGSVWQGRNRGRLEEVGQEFGVTRERIRQLQNIALRKLRRALQKKEDPIPKALRNAGSKKKKKTPQPEGYLVVAIRNDWGGKRLEEQARGAFGVGVETLSKHHCRVFRCVKDEVKANHALLDAWSKAGAMRRLPDTGYWSQPGLFSWDRVDAGSKLLAESLPETLSGVGADLGVGWGYLSTELLKRCPDVDGLDCYEVDGRALEPARRNLGNVLVPLRPKIFWRDVPGGVGLAKYDFIIMNPPFHEGRDADPGLGIKFIAAAARALKPMGSLWMVANKHLPYEGVLQDAFAEVRTGAQRLGFKILVATGPDPKLHRQAPQRRKTRRR
jgi:16S rRNA (guanine1207-N2)-methyltransferase